MACERNAAGAQVRNAHSIWIGRMKWDSLSCQDRTVPSPWYGAPELHSTPRAPPPPHNPPTFGGQLIFRATAPLTGAGNLILYGG